jgi:hypothetical protein
VHDVSKLSTADKDVLGVGNKIPTSTAHLGGHALSEDNTCLELGGFRLSAEDEWGQPKLPLAGFEDKIVMKASEHAGVLKHATEEQRQKMVERRRRILLIFEI